MNFYELLLRFLRRDVSLSFIVARYHKYNMVNKIKKIQIRSFKYLLGF